MSLSTLELDFAHNYFFGDKSLFNAESDLCRKLFVSYVQDKNSSTIREEVTLKFLNIPKLPAKHGADGYDEFRNVYVEVKPCYAHINPKTKRQGRLGGGGTFNDLTEKKIKELETWHVVCSGFAEDKCLFVIRFPASQITPHLKARLQKNIENKRGRVGTVGFGYKHFETCNELEVLHFDKENGDRLMNKKFYKLLSEKMNDRKLP